MLGSTNWYLETIWAFPSSFNLIFLEEGNELYVCSLMYSVYRCGCSIVNNSQGNIVGSHRNNFIFSVS